MNLSMTSMIVRDIQRHKFVIASVSFVVTMPVAWFYILMSISACISSSE
jgi:hypothetical protein